MMIKMRKLVAHSNLIRKAEVTKESSENRPGRFVLVFANVLDIKAAEIISAWVGIHP